MSDFGAQASKLISCPYSCSEFNDTVQWRQHLKASHFIISEDQSNKDQDLRVHQGICVECSGRIANITAFCDSHIYECSRSTASPGKLPDRQPIQYPISSTLSDGDTSNSVISVNK